MLSNFLFYTKLAYVLRGKTGDLTSWGISE